MSTRIISVPLALFALAAIVAAAAEEKTAPPRVISLAGQWRFALDPNKEGGAKEFFNRELPERIQLPGSTDEAHFGTPHPNKPTLDGLYRLHTYEGPAWYQREVEIPAAWQGKRVLLFLERTHWETRLWVDGRYVGTQDSLIAPHRYDLGTTLAPGKHRLTICVDNTLKFNLGRFVSINYEGTQTNWNGLIGRLELRAVDPVAIEDVQVYTDVDRKLAKVRVTVSNVTGRPAAGTLTLSATDRQSGRKVPPQTVEFTAAKGQTSVTAELPLARASKDLPLPLGEGTGRRQFEDTPLGEEVRLWDEFSPALYDLRVSLAAGYATKSFADQRTVTFGMREFAARGTQFTINGRPIFLRGTLECAIFPLTGYPPMDADSWRRIYRVIKSYGLNHMRFHSWCPPEAAFAAADLEGVMLQAEGPQANVPVGADAARDAFLEQELIRIVRTYGNHPSFCLMTLGNEYGGPDEILSRFVGMLRDEDPRHLYSSASSAQKTANRQFTESGPRGIHGPGTDADFREAIAKQDRPLVGHEIGQWTFFPNFAEIPKYTGVLAAKNFELVRDDLAAKGMLELAPRFVEATGRHAVLLYKEEIEVLLRTPGHAGFSLLDLHDYPGQGTALVGPLDPFWESKGFVTPEVHRTYCGPTVPLLRMTKRTYTADETFTAEAEVAHFGPKDLLSFRLEWSISDTHGRNIAMGMLPYRDVPTGKVTPYGSINAPLATAVLAPLATFAEPRKLTVSIWHWPPEDWTPTWITNEWEIWVYPPGGPPSAPADVLISNRWDEATKSALAEGRKVLLFPRVVNPSRALPGKFLPVFWSPIWFPKQRPNTMGILYDPKHPALAQFPTEFHSNWQWYELLEHSQSLILDDTPADFRPIVQVIDNFARNHKLGNLFEARLGKGRLLVCSIDLPRIADKDPAAKQLLRSLYTYVGSAVFQPEHELKVELLDTLFSPSSGGVMQKLGARVAQADSQQPGYEAAHVLDGDPTTIWHTPWGEGAPDFPHEIVVELEQPVAVQGCKLLPRQDMRNGRIKGYEIYLSSDGKQWGPPVAQGEFAAGAELKTVRFDRPLRAKFLKFVALSAFEKKPYASLAELEVIAAGP
jgi:hypothetical protein